MPSTRRIGHGRRTPTSAANEPDVYVHELVDVSADQPSNNDTLLYDASRQLWVSGAGGGGGGAVTQIIAGNHTTITPAAGTGNVTINATSAGSQSQIQVGGAASTFSVTASPAIIDNNGNIETTQSATTGEVKCTAVVVADPGAPDTAWGGTNATGTSKLFKMTLRNNLLTLNTLGPFFQAVAGATYQFGNPGIPGVGYGYPSGFNELMWNSGSSQAMATNSIMGEIRQGSTFPAGATFAISYGVHDPATGTDNVIYDPLNLRAKGTGASSGGLFQFYQFGFNPNSLKVPGCFHIHVQIRGGFAAPHPSVTAMNVFNVSANRYNGAGNLVGTFQIGDIVALNGGGRRIEGSTTRWVRAYDGNDTHANWGPLEHIRINIRNVGTLECTDVFAEACITWFPNP